MKNILSRLACLIVLALHGHSFAAVHTWIKTPTPMIQQAGGNSVVLDPVIIVGSTIGWGNGNFDTPISEQMAYLGGSISSAIQQARFQAVDLSSVCKNPAISAAAKATTSGTDTTDRWLASQEMFNSLLAHNWLTLYNQAINITVIIDGKTYRTFSVTYADGARETWVIKPDYMTSSVKLFDSPAPGSLTAPSPAKGCTV